MNQMCIKTLEGSEKIISLEEFYTILSFLESMNINTSGMIMSYTSSSDVFILSKILDDNEEIFKHQNVYFKFDLENDSFIVKNEIKGNMYDNKEKVTLYQDFAKFIKEDDELLRYTVSFYQVFDRKDDPKIIENYNLYIANFLDFCYEKYGEMGNLVTVPIVKDSYKVSENYNILDGVNNNKMIKKRY